MSSKVWTTLACQSWVLLYLSCIVCYFVIIGSCCIENRNAMISMAHEHLLSLNLNIKSELYSLIIIHTNLTQQSICIRQPLLTQQISHLQEYHASRKAISRSIESKQTTFRRNLESTRLTTETSTLGFLLLRRTAKQQRSEADNHNTGSQSRARDAKSPVFPCA